MATVTDDFLDTEFREGDLDDICIRAQLTELIAVALGMPADAFEENVDEVDIEDWLEEAQKVLVALVQAGVIRRAHLVYDETTHTVRHV